MGHTNVENETARNVNFRILKITKGRRKCPDAVTRGSDQARKCSKNAGIVVYNEYCKILTDWRHSFIRHRSSWQIRARLATYWAMLPWDSCAACAKGDDK